MELNELFLTVATTFLVILTGFLLWVTFTIITVLKTIQSLVARIDLALNSVESFKEHLSGLMGVVVDRLAEKIENKVKKF